MIFDIYYNIVYFLNLTITPSVAWAIVPLVIATVIMLVYFEKYYDEKPGWNTHLTNSLVLLFVSLALLKYIYSIDGGGLANFILYSSKTIVSIIVFLMAVLLLFLNFEHYLPEKIARHISSPLTMNLLAYIMILYVYSETEERGGAIYFSPAAQSGWTTFFSLLILFIILLAILNLIRIPIKKLFIYLKKMKEEEKAEEIKQDKKEIEKKKAEIRKQQRQLEKAEKESDTLHLKEVQKQKKQAVKLEKVIKKTAKRK